MSSPSILRREVLSKRDILSLLAVVALCFLAYVNSWENEFTNWDDRQLITGNLAIRSLSPRNVWQVLSRPVHGTYLPVRVLSYAVDYAIWRLDPLGYHLTNTVLHALCCVLLYFVVKTIFGRQTVASICAALFAVHTVHVEAVTWLSARRDVLSTFFFLVSFLCYVRFTKGADRRSRGLYILALLSYLVALLSKAMVVTLPLMILLYDALFDREGLRKEPKRFLLRYAPFWALTVALTLVHIVVAKSAGVIKQYHGGSFVWTLATMPHMLSEYLVLSFVPLNLTTVRDFQPASPESLRIVFLSLIFVVALLGAIVLICGVDRDSLFCWLWFGIALLPVANVIPISTLVAERYLYIPSVGICLFVALIFERVREQGVSAKAWATLLALVLVMFLVTTVTRNRVWASSSTLWFDALPKAPRSLVSRLNLGRVYADTGEYGKARRQFTEALKLRDFALTQNLLGDLCLRERKYREARRWFGEALKLEPENPSSHHGLALVLRHLGDDEGALKVVEHAIKLDPAYERAYRNKGVILEKLGRYGEAIDALIAAAAIDPNRGPTYYHLGNVYQKLKDNDRALVCFKRAIRLDPNHAQAHSNLGSTLAAMGRRREALNCFRTAIDLNWHLWQPHFGAALVYQTLGDRNNAAEQFGIAQYLKGPKPGGAE